MTTVQISIPDALARDSDIAGLLAPDAIESMLREQLRIKACEAWKQIQAEQEANPLPPMTMEEIQAEVNAVRAEMRLAARS